MKNYRSKSRTGLNPLAYLGVEPGTPPNFIIERRPPTTTDFSGYNIGDEWLDSTLNIFYKLVQKTFNIAIWIAFINGGTSFLVNYTTVNNSPYNVLNTDAYIGVDSSVMPITINLPNMPQNGRVFVIKDSTGSAAINNITVTTVGGIILIDGATTYVMNTAYQSIQLIFYVDHYEIF